MKIQNSYARRIKSNLVDVVYEIGLKIVNELCGMKSFAILKYPQDSTYAGTYELGKWNLEVISAIIGVRPKVQIFQSFL